MILRIFQILIFVFAATIEVKVHAAEIISLRSELSPLQEPLNCLDTGERCAVKTSSGRKHQLEVGENQVTLGSATSVVRLSANRVTLVSGTLLVKSEESFFIESEYGKIIFKSAYAIVEKEAKKLNLRVIQGEAFIQPRGKNEMYAIEPGQTNWLGEVDRSGAAQTGMSIPIDFEDHALQWSSLYSQKKDQFKKELKEFAQVWRLASKKSAAYHQELAQRRVASLKDEHQKRQTRIKKRQEYEASLRALFRKKTLDQ